MVLARRGIGRLRFLSLLVTLSVLIGVHLSHAAAQAAPAPVETGQLEWSARINDHPVSNVDRNDPLELNGHDTTVVELELTNNDLTPIELRSVRLEGRVMFMTFFRYTTRLDLVLAPGASTVRRIDLDLDDLSGQAIGLIPARLQLIDQDLQVLKEDTFPVDVKGSLTSVYGVFGLAVTGLTIVLLVELRTAVARRRLPTSPWKRGRRFLGVGVGLGLSLTFMLSVSRLHTPGPTTWLSLVAIFAAAAFLTGYLLPIWSQRRESDLADLDDLDELVDPDAREVDPDAGEADYVGFTDTVANPRHTSTRVAGPPT